MRNGLAILAALALALPAAAQAGYDRVEVRVLSVEADGVTVDAGAGDRVAEGDRVRLYPLGEAALGGVVRAVERDRARVEITTGGGAVEPGVRGEVLVPSDRPVSAAGAASAQEHPPWTAPPEEWDREMPLLAPARAPAPEERPSDWSARAWAGADFGRDRGSVANDDHLIRAGLDLLGENPFGRGGRLRVNVDGYRQYARTFDGDDQDDVRLRATRLSYAWGGTRDRAGRVEVGRFLHHEMPELGLLDGVEYAHRTAGGHRVGASLGFLPEPTDALETGRDLGVAVFGTLAPGDDDDLLLGAGFQKTWHEGAPDRDLLVLKSSWYPGDRTRVLGTAWVDFYGDGDAAKSNAVELTQLALNAIRDWTGGHGIGLFGSHVRWPDIARNEFLEPPPTGIEDYELTRAGARGWGRVHERVRLSGEAAWWQDEDDSGTYAEVGVRLQDLVWDRGSVGLAVSDTTGRFSAGLGWRVWADRAFDLGLLTVGWDAADYEQPGFSGSQAELFQHAVRAGWDMPIGADWDLSLFGEHRFGDEQDASRVGFFVQRRF